MVDGLTLRQTVKNEIEKIKGMTPKKRWEYFKTYYFVPSVIGIILLILLLFFIHDMKMGSREMLISGCFVNVETDAEGLLFLTDDYVSYCGKTQKDAVAQLSLGNTVDFFKENPLDNDSYEMALLTQICAGEYHYMVLDEDAFEHFAKLDIYADLEKTLSAAQQEKYADSLVYREAQEGQELAATAIMLSETELEKKCYLNPRNAYLVFIDVNQDIEKNRKFLDYIAEENK